MRRNKWISLLLILIILGSTTQAYADVRVKGYYRKDGTYVRPHYRSNPDGNFYNNWSTYGNTNPYTGEAGTQHYPTYNISPPPTYSPPSNNDIDENSNSVNNIYDPNKVIDDALQQSENINLIEGYIYSDDTTEEIAAKQMLVEYFNNINTRSYIPAYDSWISSWQNKHPYDKFEEGYTDVINTIDEINATHSKKSIVLKGTITAKEGWEQTTHQYSFTYKTKKIDGIWKLNKGKLKKLW